jgi:cytochrome c
MLELPQKSNRGPLQRHRWRYHVIASGAILAAFATWSNQAAASPALVQKYACVACHQTSTKLVGPSWREVAARYGTGKGTSEQLVASVKSGSSGKWGPMPMPPQVQVPDAELELLVKWILDGPK